MPVGRTEPDRHAHKVSRIRHLQSQVDLAQVQDDARRRPFPRLTFKAHKHWAHVLSWRHMPILLYFYRHAQRP